MTPISRSISQRLGPVALLLVSMSAIQSGAAIAHGLFDAVGPAGATSIRLILAALMLTAVFRPWRFTVTPGAWRTIVIYGVVLGTMNFLLYEALARIPLGIAVALEFTGPLLVATLSSRRLLDAVWIFIAAVGLGVLLWPRDGLAGPLDPLGIVFALGAGVCWALYIVFGQRAGAAHGLQSAVLGIGVAAIVIAPIGVVSAGSALLAPSVIAVGALVAVLSTALPYTLEMIALPRLPRATFGTLMSLEPAFGALSGLVLLGQALTFWQWLAVGAIMLASMGTTLTPNNAVSGEAYEAPRPD